MQNQATLNSTTEPAGTATDPLVAVLRRLHANLTVAMLRVERNPSIAAVHGVRVAARRLRSLLRAYRSDLHPVLYAGLRFDLKNLGRTLGQLREASVRRRLVRSISRSPGNFAATVGVKATKLLNARLAESERLLQAEARQLVRVNLWSERTQRIDDSLASSALLAAVPGAKRFGHRELRRLTKRVLRRLRGSKTSQRALHRLRIAVKRARYLGDILSESDSGLRDVPGREQLDLLHKLQNTLGDLNDLFGLRDWTIGEDMEPVAKDTLLREVEQRIDNRLAKFRKMRKAARSSFSESPLWTS